jgi:hypothetical protein
VKALWPALAILALSACGPLHTARQAAHDRAVCEREGYGGNSLEYQQCRAELVRKRAELRESRNDGPICQRKGYAIDTPEYDECRRELVRQRTETKRLRLAPQSDDQ